MKNCLLACCKIEDIHVTLDWINSHHNLVGLFEK